MVVADVVPERQAQVRHDLEDALALAERDHATLVRQLQRRAIGLQWQHFAVNLPTCITTTNNGWRTTMVPGPLPTMFYAVPRAELRAGQHLSGEGHIAVDSLAVQQTGRIASHCFHLHRRTEGVPVIHEPD